MVAGDCGRAVFVPRPAALADRDDWSGLAVDDGSVAAAHVIGHDIQYPFEYPDVWIFDKRWSWNEIYMVRAFLMYNDRFRVIAFNNYWGQHHRPELESACGAPVPKPGGSIWMRLLE